MATKPISGLSQSYATLQPGDWFAIDRAGVTGKTTFSQLVTEMFGDLNKTGADAALVTGTAGTTGHYATWNADGDIVGGGGKVGLELIAFKSATSSATLDFTEFNSTRYDSYVFVLQSIRPATDGAVLYMRTDNAGGASYDAGASDYSWGHVVLNHGESAPLAASDTADSQIVFLNALLGNAGGEDTSGEVKLFNASSNRRTRMTWHLNMVVNDGRVVTVIGSGARVTEASTNAVRFLFDTGNIASGNIAMYGYRSS